MHTARTQHLVIQQYIRHSTFEGPGYLARNSSSGSNTSPPVRCRLASGGPPGGGPIGGAPMGGGIPAPQITQYTTYKIKQTYCETTKNKSGLCWAALNFCNGARSSLHIEQAHCSMNVHGKYSCTRKQEAEMALSLHNAAAH